MSKLEENVRNLTTNVSNNRIETLRSTNSLMTSVNGLKSTVKWFLNFLEDLVGGSKTEDQLRTGNTSVSPCYSVLVML